MAASEAGFEGSLGHIIDQVAQEKGIDRQVLDRDHGSGDPEGGAGRVRADSRARGSLQRGHRLHRSLPVHDGGRGGDRARTRDRPGCRAASTASKRSSAKSSGSRCSGIRATPSARVSRTKSSAPCSTCSRRAAPSAASPRRRRSRCSCSACATPSATSSTTSSRTSKGQLIRGIVRRFEKGHNVIVDLGRTEGILSAPRADAARDVSPRRSHRRVRQGHRPRGARPARHPEPQRSAPGRQAVRGRGARDLRGHRQDRRRRSRARFAQQDRREHPRLGRRSGRRVRRHQGLARAGRRARAARREDRHRAVRSAIRRATSSPPFSRPR